MDDVVARRKGEEEKKVKISISLSQDTLDWLDEKVKDKTFRSVSHGLEFAVEQLKRKG